MNDTAGVIAPPPLIFLGGLAVGLGLELLLGSSVPDWVQWIGGALLLAFERAFNRRGTAVEPWKPSTAIVTDGVYRFTRNPGYLGMALVYAGIALLADALWALAPLPLVLVLIDRGVIAREERYLEGKFGEEYLGYKRGVRRWV